MGRISDAPAEGDLLLPNRLDPKSSAAGMAGGGEYLLADISGNASPTWDSRRELGRVGDLD